MFGESGRERVGGRPGFRRLLAPRGVQQGLAKRRVHRPLCLTDAPEEAVGRDGGDFASAFVARFKVLMLTASNAGSSSLPSANEFSVASVGWREAFIGRSPITGGKREAFYHKGRRRASTCRKNPIFLKKF